MAMTSDSRTTNLGNIERLPDLIRQLYAVVHQLEDMFPGRRFTPDGHLVGSIGEVLAAYYYDLELLPASAETHDAKSRDGRMVQVKATQRDRVAISSQPDHLLVLKLHKNGSWDEVYSGPGAAPWEAAGKMQKTGQRPLSLARLKNLMKEVPVKAQLLRRDATS